MNMPIAVDTVRKLIMRQHNRIVGMTTTLGNSLEITPQDVELADEIMREHGVPGYYDLILRYGGMNVDEQIEIN